MAVQAVVLIPFAWRVGYRWRPRFDFRGHGLGHAWRLARWTIAFVAVNQVTYLVIVNLANAANVHAQDSGGLSAGLTSYTRAHLLFILPHSVVTVSLAAALLPRMSAAAHAGDLRGVASDVARGLRTAAAFVVPTAAALLVLGPRVTQVLTAYGNTTQGGGRADRRRRPDVRPRRSCRSPSSTSRCAATSRSRTPGPRSGSTSC